MGGTSEKNTLYVHSLWSINSQSLFKIGLANWVWVLSEAVSQSGIKCYSGQAVLWDSYLHLLLFVFNHDKYQSYQYEKHNREICYGEPPWPVQWPPRPHFCDLFKIHWKPLVGAKIPYTGQVSVYRVLYRWPIFQGKFPLFYRYFSKTAPKAFL